MLELEKIPISKQNANYGYLTYVKNKWIESMNRFEIQKKELNNRETNQLKTIYNNYKPKSNRNDLDIVISTIYLKTNELNIGIYNSPKDLKSYQNLIIQKDKKLEILNDYNNFKLRIRYNNKIGYLDYFELKKNIDLEYLRPYLNFWFNFYN